MMLRSAVDKMLTQLPIWSGNEHKRNTPSMNTRKWFRAEKNTVYPDPMESSFDEEPLLQTDCHSFSVFDGNTVVLSELPGVSKQSGNETKSRFICRQPSGSDRCERLKEHVLQIRSGFGNYAELKDNRLCTIVRPSKIPIYGFKDTDTDITYISASDHIKWSCPNSPKPTLTGNVRRHGPNPVDIFKLPLPTNQPNSLNHSQKHGMIAQPKLPLSGVSSCNQKEDNSPKRLRVTGNDIRDSQSTPVANSVKLSSTAAAWNELDIPKQLTISSGQHHRANNLYATSNNQPGKQAVFESPAHPLSTKEISMNQHKNCAHCDPSKNRRLGDVIPIIVTGYTADHSENYGPRNRATVNRIDDRMLKTPLRRRHWSFKLYEFDAQKLTEDTDGIIRSVVAVMSASLKRTVLVRKPDLRRKRPRICVRWLDCSHSQLKKEPGSFELQVRKAAEPSAQICIEVACQGYRAHSQVGLNGRYFPTSVRSRNSARTLRRADHRNLRNSEEEGKRERFHQWEARQSYQKICRSKTDCCTPSETDAESTHHHSIRHTSSVVTLTNESVACHSSSSSFNLTVDRRAHSADKRCEFNCGSHSTPGQKKSFEVCVCHTHNIPNLMEAGCRLQNSNPDVWTALRTLHLCGASSHFRHARRVRQSQRMSVSEAFRNHRLSGRTRSQPQTKLEKNCETMLVQNPGSVALTSTHIRNHRCSTEHTRNRHSIQPLKTEFSQTSSTKAEIFGSQVWSKRRSQLMDRRAKHQYRKNLGQQHVLQWLDTVPFTAHHIASPC